MQAGVSLATADRVLNQRSGVHPRTVHRVHEAVRELDRQGRNTALLGRRFVVDVVIEAPRRFSDAVRLAAEQEIAALRPASFRLRFHLLETPPAQEIVDLLGRIARRGSHGVILKAPDVPAIAHSIKALAAAGIPTVTLVTDLPTTARCAYVGVDNRAAGATAAFLIAAWLPDRPATVLVTLSSKRFHGEEERKLGFGQALRCEAPYLRVHEISEGQGLDRQTGHLVGDALAADPAICSVYSIGGGNTAVKASFAAARRRCDVFIGHDLDDDNRRLLLSGGISAVLYHDLQQDVRLACQHILRAHGALPAVPAGVAQDFLSAVQIVTRHNLPPRSTPGLSGGG